MNWTAILVISMLMMGMLMTNTRAVNFEFTPGRRWYVGGDFKSVIKGDTSSMEVNNIAYFDGKEWYSFAGNGTNGPVDVVHVDLCYNVYIGGRFTTIDGKPFHYVAKYDYFSRTWKKLTNPEWFSNPSSNTTVKAISTNCARVQGFCSCSVIIGGHFVMKHEEEEAVHVARLLPAAADAPYTLDALGGQENHKFAKDTGMVHAIHKKNWGSTVAVQYIWVGGHLKSTSNASIYFGRIELNNNKKWEDFTAIDGNVNGLVRQFAYYPQTIGFTDEMYVVGDFNFEGTANKAICQYICHFDHALKRWITLGDSTGSTQPNGPVYTLGLNGKHLFIGGDFENTLEKSEGSGYTINDRSQKDAIGSSIVTHLSVCGDYDLSCKGGSIAVAGTNNLLRFYNTKLDKWVPFNGGTSGQVNSIVTNFQWRGSENYNPFTTAS